MIKIGNTIASDDLRDSYFACELSTCKGACCVEGDLGAPLEQEELKILDDLTEVVKPYLSREAIEALENQGAYVLDEDGEYSTTTVGGKECVFAIYDDQGIVKCGIEKAWSEKKTNFQKPISCHLYPIRAKKFDQFTAINYDRWNICSPACHHGSKNKIPLYVFLKEPLIRKFGEEWYQELLTFLSTEEKADDESKYEKKVG
ncbi:MAG: DUF3109 family protein [Cyclobacteriaceae bacterium]|nr:DUF3109 family protein [Cyclobacteriaceae bacterium]